MHHVHLVAIRGCMLAINSTNVSLGWFHDIQNPKVDLVDLLIDDVFFFRSKMIRFASGRRIISGVS